MKTKVLLKKGEGRTINEAVYGFMTMKSRRYMGISKMEIL